MDFVGVFIASHYDLDSGLATCARAWTSRSRRIYHRHRHLSWHFGGCSGRKHVVHESANDIARWREPQDVKKRLLGSIGADAEADRSRCVPNKLQHINQKHVEIATFQISILCPTRTASHAKKGEL